MKRTGAGMQNSRQAYVNLALATAAFAVAFAAWSMISPLSHQIQARRSLSRRGGCWRRRHLGKRRLDGCLCLCLSIGNEQTTGHPYMELLYMPGSLTTRVLPIRQRTRGIGVPPPCAGTP